MKNYFILIIVCITLFKNIYSQKTDIFFDKSPKKYKIKRSIILDINKRGKHLGNELYPVEILRISYKNKRDKQSLFIYQERKRGELGKKASYHREILFRNDTMYIVSLDGLLVPHFIFNEASINDTLYIQNSFFSLNNHIVFLERISYYSDLDDFVYVFNLERGYFTEISGIVDKGWVSSIDYVYINKIAISKKYGFIWIRYRFLGRDAEIWYQ